MQISSKVARVLEAEQIARAALDNMLSHAAITRIRGFNRRYYHWLFLVRGDVLEDMQRVQMTEIGNGDTRIAEEHDACAGQGCRACAWVGQIQRRIKDKKMPAHEPFLTNSYLRHLAGRSRAH